MNTTTLPPLQAAVLRAIEDGHTTLPEIVAATGRHRESVRSSLLALNGKGLVKRKLNTNPSEWRLP
jgi:DNA-binding IclR family transcriptional regulator